MMIAAGLLIIPVRVIAADADFELNERGYARHWLVSGARETPYAGKPAADPVLRRLIGNRFWPFGALARSLKLEALISMPGCCQMGL